MEHPEETYTFFAWGGDPRPDPEPPPEPWVMIISIAASLSTIIQVILMIMEMSKKNKEKKVGKAKQKLDPRDGDTIEEIRVQMSDGTRLHLEVWRTNPEKVIEFIQIFHNSSSPKPLHVLFLLRSGTIIRITISDNTEHQRQLDEIIQLLKEES